MKKLFTLVELIAVIVVLGFLAAIIVPNISNMQKESITANINSSTRTIQTAVDKYKFENEGKYPTLMQPSVENPQLINVELLYPKYIKNKPDLVKIKGQRFWIDSYGIVWGATVDTASPMYEGQNNLEWKHQENVVGYNVYEMNKTKTTSAAKNSGRKFIQNIQVEDLTSLVKISKGDDSSSYLISSIDEYGLETAPVGLSHIHQQDWFTPISNKEGIFTFELVADELMYFDGFSKYDYKPQGTEIIYEFATAEDNFTLYEKDITKLPPSKHLKVKITTKSFGNKYPSVYNLIVRYHFAKEGFDAFQPLKLPSLPPEINKTSGSAYKGTLGSGSKIISLYRPTSSDGGSYTTEVWYSPVTGEDYQKANSLTEIPSGSDFFIWVNHPEGVNISNPPIVTTEINPKIKEVTINKPTGGNSSNLETDEWQTLQTITFMASTEDGQIAKWIKAEIEDSQPEGTQILYRYSTGNGFSWSQEYATFDKLASSKILRVRAYIQKKRSINELEKQPEINSIRIYNERGYRDLSLVTPTASIILEKDNNSLNENISTSSNLTWKYEAVDPRNKQIIDAEWTTNKANNYPTAGNYKVGVRVKNESGYWSDWSYLELNVLNEKPTVTIDMAESTFIQNEPINWSHKAVDPDGDKIATVEWTENKKDRYDTTGDYNVGVRVKDSDGNWSEWAYKSIKVIPYPNVTTVPSDNQFFQFEGSAASYMKSAAISNVTSGDFTLEFSSLMPDVYNTDELIFSLATQNEDNEIFIYMNNGYLSYILQGQDTKRVTSNVFMADNQLHHYAVVYSSGEKKIKIYKDKELAFEREHPDFRDFSTSGIVFIGQDQDSYGGTLDSTQSLHGFLKEVRFWNIALPKSFLDNMYGNAVTNSSPYLPVNVSTTSETQQGTSTVNNVKKVLLSQTAYPKFLGTSSSYAIKNVTGFPNNQFTVSFWMNKTKNSSGGNHIFSYATKTSDNTVLIRDVSNKLGILMNNTTVNTPVDIPIGQWTHVTVTWNSATGTLEFYKNGVLSHTTTLLKGTLLNSTGCIVLGQDQDTVCGTFDSSQTYAGSLKHVNVYNKVLSSEEIKTDMNLTTPVAPFTQLIPKEETIWDIFYKNKIGVYRNVDFTTQ